MVYIILVVIAFVLKVSEECEPIYRCGAVDYKESLIISNDQTWIGVRVRRIPATAWRQIF